MSKFSELARLEELEKQATPGKWAWSVDCENCQDGSGKGSSSSDLEIIDNRGCTVCTFIEYAEYEGSIENASLLTDLRNAAPWLLKIAESFEPGDARCLKNVLALVRAVTGPETESDELACLRRLQAAAAEIEHDA